MLQSVSSFRANVREGLSGVCRLPDPSATLRLASLETQGRRLYSTQHTYENLLLLRPVKLNKKENVMELDINK